MRGHRDLEIACGGAVLCAILALAIPPAGLSLLFAAPLLLFAPGYAIVALTFARRALPRPQVLVLSLALSLAILVLGSFVLNYLPGGLRPLSWALLVLLVVLGCCRGAALRRVAAGPRRALRRPRIGRLDAGLLLGGALLAVAALVLAQTTLPADKARGYTELWVTPRFEMAEIGVGSEEQHEASYLLRAKVGDEIALKQRFTLAPGETRTVDVIAPAPAARAQVLVAAQLYRKDDPGRPYRRVFAWVPGAGG